MLQRRPKTKNYSQTSNIRRPTSSLTYSGKPSKRFQLSFPRVLRIIDSWQVQYTPGNHYQQNSTLISLARYEQRRRIFVKIWITECISYKSKYLSKTSLSKVSILNIDNVGLDHYVTILCFNRLLLQMKQHYYNTRWYCYFGGHVFELGKHFLVWKNQQNPLLWK